MDRVNMLCTMDRVMMESFSQRTVGALKKHTLFRLALPPFAAFLQINVDKEVEKDRLIISKAAAAHQSGNPPTRDHVTTLLRYAREIDQRFLHQATPFPIRIRIRYQDIEHHRRQRIELLLDTSYRVFVQWQAARSFRKAVHTLYSEQQFRSLLKEILHLYAVETRMLSRSVRLPHLITLARDGVTQTISSVMEREAENLAGSLSRQVYRRLA